MGDFDLRIWVQLNHLSNVYTQNINDCINCPDFSEFLSSLNIKGDLLVLFANVNFWHLLLSHNSSISVPCLAEHTCCSWSNCGHSAVKCFSNGLELSNKSDEVDGLAWNGILWPHFKVNTS